MNKILFYKFTMDSTKYDNLDNEVIRTFGINSHLYLRDGYTLELFYPKKYDFGKPISIYLKTNHLEFNKIFSKAIGIEPEEIETMPYGIEVMKYIGGSPTMKDITESQLHKSLYDFMSDINYEVKILEGPCDKDHTEVVEHMKKLGYEIFPHVMTTNHKECSIFLRKKK